MNAGSGSGFFQRWAAWLVLGAAVGFFPAGSVLAEESTLPPAETILGQYIEATGGKAAYDKVNNRSSRIAFHIVGTGITAEMTLVQARPNKMYTVLEAQEIGKIESGTDGDVAWERSTKGGARIKEGLEREEALREAFLDKLARWKEIYDKAECTGVEDVLGSPAFRVVLSPKTGSPAVLFFDRTTRLLVKVIVTISTPGGELAVENYPSDYRWVDGILLAHTIRVKIGPEERVMTVQSIQHNLELAPETFQPPASLKVPQ